MDDSHIYHFYISFIEVTYKDNLSECKYNSWLLCSRA